MNAATAAASSIVDAFGDAARNVTETAAEEASQGNTEAVLSVSEGMLGGVRCGAPLLGWTWIVRCAQPLTLRCLVP